MKEKNGISKREQKLKTADADALLEKYRLGKAELDNRITANEQWWRLRHWGEFANTQNGIGADADGRNCKPTSAWLFNSIANKHADAMDNYPEATVLPRSECDKQTAETLSAVLPVCLERCGYEQVYSDGWWYKLKNGTSCQGVFWNPTLEQGRGGIEVKSIDILKLFWEPGITDIQDSPAVFYLQKASRRALAAAYKDKDIPMSSPELTAQYKSENTAYDDDKLTVVDMYYKVSEGGRVKLHLMKYVGNTVLYDSAEDGYFESTGLYEHGMYPFVFDAMYKVAGNICGLGCIDIMKDAQMYIDRLGQVILDHTIGLSKKRFFIRNNSSVNESEFKNSANPFVHVAGSISSEDIREIDLSPLDSSVIAALNMKIDELKETSGNRDFSQGSTSNGVTAASAIAALQEAGSKLSRDMIKSSYRAFSRVCELIIATLRQYCDTPREYYSMGKFARFSGRMLRGDGGGTIFNVPAAISVPDFDVSVKAAKNSPFSRAAQNELVRELYSLGFFRPENAEAALIALDAMDFDGKAEMMKSIRAGRQTKETDKSDAKMTDRLTM